MASKKAYSITSATCRCSRRARRKELETIARAGDEITMTAGTMLVDQGQTGREAFVVLDGRSPSSATASKIATLGPGAIVGELSLLDHGPRTATVECDTDCTLFVIDQRHFLAVLDDVPVDRRTSCSPPSPAASASSTASTTAESTRPSQRPVGRDERPHS